jgi:hypothetical protein
VALRKGMVLVSRVWQFIASPDRMASGRYTWDMIVLDFVRTGLSRLQNISSRQRIKVRLESGEVGPVEKIVMAR